jgi:hypothetical protein
MGGERISFRCQGKKVKAMTLEERDSPGASGLEVLYDGRNKFHISAIEHTDHLRSDKRNNSGECLY